MVKMFNSTSTPYYGNTSIIIASGDSMHIARTDWSIASHNNNNLILDELLLVPNAFKNLLSVQKLYADDKVKIEFDK